MNETLKLPFYAKLAFILLGIILIGFIFYVGQGIIVPIMMAFLIAILLRPVVVFLNKKMRFPTIIP